MSAHCFGSIVDIETAGTAGSVSEDLATCTDHASLAHCRAAYGKSEWRD
jgi:hypothetical protein